MGETLTLANTSRVRVLPIDHVVLQKNATLANTVPRGIDRDPMTLSAFAFAGQLSCPLFKYLFIKHTYFKWTLNIINR
jgi:hypothetical protein